MLRLALGIRVPSDTLNDALSPPGFQIKGLEIYDKGEGIN